MAGGAEQDTQQKDVAQHKVLRYSAVMPVASPRK